MEIFPEIARMRLGDCPAGRLLRLKWSDAQPYAMVATGEDQRFLVLLSDAGDRQQPEIFLLQRPDLWAIVYASPCRIEVDQSPEHVDLTGQRLWDKNGALIVAEEHYLLHVRASPQSQLLGSLYLRLDTGALVAEPAGGAAIFGKWSLSLAKGVERYETLLTIG